MKYCGFATNYEKKMSFIILEYQLPFYFVGNMCFKKWKFCPDFIHLHYPLTIEVYKKEYHSENYENERLIQSQQEGFENTLFLSDNDFNRDDWESHLLEKVKTFLKPYDEKFERGKIYHNECIKTDERKIFFTHEEFQNMTKEQDDENFYNYAIRTRRYNPNDFDL